MPYLEHLLSIYNLFSVWQDQRNEFMTPFLELLKLLVGFQYREQTLTEDVLFA
jgi:hypothetical protein